MQTTTKHTQHTVLGVFGGVLCRYTCVEDEELDDDEEEELLFCELDDDEEELCEPDDEEELDELLLCEPDEDELLFCEPDDDTCCSICCGEEYSTLKALPSNTTVPTEVG